MEASRKSIWGWALYDWANSVFATTVIAGFFPIFFKQFWSAGADVSVPTQSSEGMDPETYARSRRDYFASNPMDYDFAGVYREATEILEGTRLAGSYKGYVLAPFKELLRLRSLLARGRARIEPDAPEAVARLFGGRIGAMGAEAMGQHAGLDASGRRTSERSSAPRRRSRR